MSNVYTLRLRKAITVVLAIASLVAFLFTSRSASAAGGSPGAVYVITNDPASNAVQVFDRAADGTLTPAGVYPTGGAGTGSGLGSQGALVLARDNRLLFAVNAGSNTVSAFRVLPNGLQFIGAYPSGGERPVSVTTFGPLLYVLNAGGSGNIAGFWIKFGQLIPIPGSIQPLSNGGVGAAPGPAQIQFNTRGNVLVVTEKATNRIDTYTVNAAGVAAAPTTHPSVGNVPFGFDIDRQDHVVVSEAQASGASSYAVGADGSLNVISPAVVNGQGAACWLVISKNGRYAYTANAATNNISGYSIAADGSLTLLSGTTATGMQPLDMSISNDGAFLYVIDGRSDVIMGFLMQPDGSLAPLPTQVPVAATALGMAAR